MNDAGDQLKVWRDLVSVRARFTRSIHIERDARSTGALEGYVLTPLVRAVTGRVLDGLTAAVPARAWSITGPYGTGKSAFALFLANLVGPATSDATVFARDLAARVDPSLAAAFRGASALFPEAGGLVPVLATGERRQLAEVLLDGLNETIASYWSGRGAKPRIAKQAKKLVDRAARGEQLRTREVVDLFEAAARKVADSTSDGHGLLVVLDEAGKLLEHASAKPDLGDMQLLQELAEAANRSGDTPIVFVVMMHQAFEQYAGRLSVIERNEWAKVQGRFEDIPFLEGATDVVRLIGEALGRQEQPGPVASAVRKSVQASLKARIMRTGGERRELAKLLETTSPLHPCTALMLGPLFRSRLAQNERSLFAFLSTGEPNGFQEFLDRPTHSGKTIQLLTPDVLYDYVTGSLGGRLHGHLGKQWAQVEVALRRLPEGAGGLEACLLKSIGLLGMFGDAAGLPASTDTLVAIYGHTTAAAERSVKDSLERLRSASLVVFRKFRNSYQLWEGSDLDLDTLTHQALEQVDTEASLLNRMTRIAPPRALVARRHLFETGTFRYFDVRYVDSTVFDGTIPDVDVNADGQVLLVIEPNASERERLVRRLTSSMAVVYETQDSKPTLVGVPGQIARLADVGSELAALDWVQTHTPELNDDPVARRELAGRLVEAERTLQDEAQRLLGADDSSVWLRNREVVNVRSPRELAERISDICDEAYDRCPEIHNELVNRRQLSSAAAAARRTLMEAMVLRGGEHMLGIEGNPPEASMYKSVLQAHRIHGKRQNMLGFGKPSGSGVRSMLPAWEQIERVFDGASGARIRVSDVYAPLRRPPFGIKDGVLPLLLLSSLLAWRDEIAVYEDGAFVPGLSGAVVERMLKRPQSFEVQKLSIVGPRAALFERLSELLSRGSTKRTTGVLPLVRQLVRMANNLPDSTKNTQNISPKSRAVREALLTAREPAPLIFTDLPTACGHDPFQTCGADNDDRVESFVVDLRRAIDELNQAYPRLLDRIEDALRESFALPPNAEKLRRELAVRAKRLRPHAVDAHLTAFLMRAGETDVNRQEWLVSLGTFLGTKPPDSWNDRDVEQMYVSLGTISRRFEALEAMTIHSQDADLPEGTRLLRISVAQAGQTEAECVVAIRHEDAELVESVRRQITELLEHASASLPLDALLAAVGSVSSDLISRLRANETRTTT